MSARAPAPRLHALGALVAVAIWGGSFVAVRVALPGLPPFALVASRLVLAAACLLVVQRLLQPGPLLPAPGDRRRCALLGAVLGLHSLVQALGLQYTSAINTGWIVSAIPVLIALGAWLVLGQRLRGIGWVGVATASAGVLLVTASTPGDFARARLGDLLQLASCVTWAVYTLAAGAVVARNGALRVTTFALAVAALLALAAALVAGEQGPVLTADVVLAVLYLAVLSNAVALLLWYRALDALGPTRTGAMLYAEPFFTLAASWWLLDEPLGPLTVPGGLVVLLGVWLVRRG